jgi:hypothetical protein
MQTESLVPCSQQLVTSSYHAPDVFSPRIPTLFLQYTYVLMLPSLLLLAILLDLFTSRKKKKIPYAYLLSPMRASVP